MQKIHNMDFNGVRDSLEGVCQADSSYGFPSFSMRSGFGTATLCRSPELDKDQR
jgi:hypothetical protein